MSRMVVHNLVLEAGDELHVTVASANNNTNASSVNAVVGNMEGGKNRKNNTRKQEGGKKKLSGFMKFSKDNRASVLKENPGIEFAGVGKKLGEKWRALSDAEKKRY